MLCGRVLRKDAPLATLTPTRMMKVRVVYITFLLFTEDNNHTCRSCT
jgi:hypothetical protein